MHIEEVLDILENTFAQRQTELVYKNPFELLIAVMLSAQTTDQAVNKATPALFVDYPDAYAMSQAEPKQIEQYIKSIGLYKNKARYAVACSQRLVDVYHGEVPQTRDELMSLPGVGRKTANVVLAEAFDLPAIAVDTHVARVAVKIGIADAGDDVLLIEKKLMEAIPETRWARAHLLLLLFGRYYATARSKENVYDLLEKLKEQNAYEKNESK